MKIHSGWQFREVGKTDWYNATVPGCVHTDLLANKLIDDPFYRDDEKKQQWIGKTDWEYRTSFRVTAQTVERENVELVFEGLDTYAGVYLKISSDKFAKAVYLAVPEHDGFFSEFRSRVALSLTEL